MGGMSAARARIRIVAPAWLLVAIGFCLGPGAGARELVDATHARVALVDHPSRIITLTPSLGELAARIQGKEINRIVGVSAHSDQPPALAQAPSVASAGKINLEAVVSLHPDLVLASREDNPADQLAHLRELHIPVFVTSATTLAGIEETLRMAGEALGHAKAGDLLADRLRRGIERFEARAAARRKRGEPRPRVLLELDDNPLIVVGGSNFVNEEVEALGALNVYGEGSRAYPRVSMEDALRRDPGRILILGNASGMTYFRGLVRNWERFPAVSAVRLHKVQALAADAIVRPGLRILQGMTLLEKAIYGARSGQ